MKTKEHSLAVQLEKLFVLFAVVTLISSALMTYFGQNKTYHGEYIRSLRELTGHLSESIEREKDEFPLLKRYFSEHGDLVRVPEDFRQDLPRAKSAFFDYLKSHYTDSTWEADLFFDDLDEEGQRLYVNYRFEYWFTVFFDSADEFGMSYVYYIYPVEGEDHKMCYMFDPTLPLLEDESEKILFLGDEVYEDPSVHKYMWLAWDTGEAQTGVDVLDNEFGYVYTYCMPLTVNGEKIGLVCAEVDVSNVRNSILLSVLRQVAVLFVVLAITTFVLFLFLRKRVIKPVIRLEGEVRQYSEKKDPSVADTIRGEVKYNDELGKLYTGFADMIGELENYMKDLQTVTAEKEKIHAELSVATQIQADMLPRIFPSFPDRDEFSLHASMDPAKEVGGDFYDFFLVDRDHLAMVIADVSGKGVPAALFMVIAKTLIKSRLMMGDSPSEALANVNDQLCEGNDAELFVTVWIGLIDLRTGHVTEVNAGHEHPAIMRAGGKYELHVTKHSPAVATLEGLSFRQTEFDMAPGDRLFVYTDGVPEATNAQEMLYGTDRMLEALNSVPDATTEELLNTVKQSTEEFVGEAPQFDDLTMLGFYYFGESK